MRRTAIILPLILATAASSWAANSFEVFPAEVNLKFQRDSQSLVCRLTEPNGINRNVTTEAKITVADPTKAKVENGIVYPLADGQTTLKVEFKGQSVDLPVKIEAVKTDPGNSSR